MVNIIIIIKNYIDSNLSYNKNDPNNNSVGNLLDEYWTDKITSPDTSEHFALKIENFNKISKHKPKPLKEKSAKPTKMILNIPNSNFRKNLNMENTNIPNSNVNYNNFNSCTINNDQKINEFNKIKNPNITICNNKILVEVPNKTNFNINNSNVSNSIKKNGICEIPNPNSNSELDDDTNESIPAEYNGLMNMPYRSTKNNDLKDINSRCTRLNTDNPSYNINDHFYSNMKVSPNKDPAIKLNNNNNIISNIIFH